MEVAFNGFCILTLPSFTILPETPNLYIAHAFQLNKVKLVNRYGAVTDMNMYGAVNAVNTLLIS